MILTLDCSEPRFHQKPQLGITASLIHSVHRALPPVGWLFQLHCACVLRAGKIRRTSQTLIPADRQAGADRQTISQISQMQMPDQPVQPDQPDAALLCVCLLVRIQCPSVFFFIQATGCLA